MFTNILLATDFSPCSQGAVSYARGLALLHGSTLHLLHVLDPEPTPGEFIPDPDSDDNWTAERKMEELASSDALKDIPHTHSLRSGVVWEVVSEVVLDLGIDLVIVGTSGAGGLRHLVLGSVAEKILRHTTCPVLTVGPDTRNRGLADGNVRTILCATDFSPVSENALNHSLKLAHASGAQLVLLHAVDPDEAAENEIEQMTLDAEQRLFGSVESRLDVPCRVLVDRGTAADVILRRAESLPADVIVMGAHPGSAAAHIPWTVVHRVISDSLCPVVTLGD